MAQSSYNTCTVKDRDRKSYEDSWETKKPYNQRYFDLRSVTYYQQTMSQYHGDNMTYFGQYSMTHKDYSGQKYLSHGNTGNNESIVNVGNLRVPRPQLSRPLAVPGSTPPKSRPSPPLFQPPSSRSQMPSAISRPLTPACQPPSPRPRSLLPTSRPPTPRPRPPTPKSRPPTPRPQSPSRRCQPPSQETQTMHNPSAFTYHQFQIQHGSQMETHNYSYQQSFYEDGGYWNHPEICYKDSYYVPTSRTSEVQPCFEKERNEENYLGSRQMLINGTKHKSSEYTIQAQINERKRVSTSTYPSTEEHNQNSVEYFQQNGRNKNEPSSQLTFLPIEEISQTKYEKNKSIVSPRTGSLQGQSQSRRNIRTGQYRKAPYATKSIRTPTNIRLRSTGRTSETESNIQVPVYGSFSPLQSNVPLLQNCDTNVVTNAISGQRSQEQSLERQGNMHISQSGIVTPLIRASYLEDGTASTVYPAMSLDSDRRVLILYSRPGGTVGANMRLKYDRVLSGCQIPQQWARPVKQYRHSADRTHATRWGKYNDLANDMRLSCQEPNQKYTDWRPADEGNQNFPDSTKKTFISNATEQYSDSKNDICKTAVMDEIHTEIATPSKQSDSVFNKANELRPKHLQTEETLHILKEMVTEENASNKIGITDSPKAAESKDGPQNNPTIVALIDRLLTEARTACDLLQQQGQWQQENTTRRIRIEKSEGGRPNTSCLFDTSSNKTDMKDKRTPFSRISMRLHSGTGGEQKEIEVTREIRLLMSDLKICGNIVASAETPFSSGTWPTVKKDLDSNKEEEKSYTKTCIKEEIKRCAMKAKRRLSSNSLSLTMNTSNECVDRVFRIVSSEDLLSTRSESNGSVKRGKRVLRQEEEEKEKKEDNLVNGARNSHTKFSELSENTKRAGSSLSEQNITGPKRQKPEEEVTRSALIQRDKNIEPEEKSKKRKFDENENDTKPSYSDQEHEGPVSSDYVLESRKKRTKKQVDEDDVPKSPCFSQEPLRSHSKHESSNKSFISEANDSNVNNTKIV